MEWLHGEVTADAGLVVATNVLGDPNVVYVLILSTNVIVRRQRSEVHVDRDFTEGLAGRGGRIGDRRRPRDHGSSGRRDVRR